MTDVSAHIGGTPVAVRYDGPIAPNPDAALPTFLLTAMRRGEALTLDEPISESVLAGATEVQRVVSMWWPETYRPIEIVAQTRADPHTRQPDEGSAASFFSCGVDSFYSAVTNERITQLVFVHGFDVALSDRNLRGLAATAAKDAAAELGKELLEVETDARAVLGVNWEHVHGAVMAAIGMLLDTRP